MGMKRLLILSLFLSSCTWARQTDRAALTENADHALLFLVFKIRKNAGQDGSSIELLSKTQGAGKVKQIKTSLPAANHFLGIDVYRENKVVYTMTIDHPLYKRVEYADETGKLASKDIELDEAEFFIRMPVQGDAVKISETIRPGAEKLLTKIKL